MWTERQQRFLTACAEEPIVARAARRAGVHRATVYRWRANPAFQEAMRAAWETWHRKHLARCYQAEAERQRWRQQREAERLPMRRRILAAARAAKRR